MIHVCRHIYIRLAQISTLQLSVVKMSSFSDDICMPSYIYIYKSLAQISTLQLSVVEVALSD